LGKLGFATWIEPTFFAGVEYGDIMWEGAGCGLVQAG